MKLYFDIFLFLLIHDILLKEYEDKIELLVSSLFNVFYYIYQYYIIGFYFI